MEKIIIGLVGQMASGKGTTAKYLMNKYGASTYRFSTILRDILDRLYLPHSRSNLQNLSEILRRGFGEDILSKAVVEDLKNDKNKMIAIDGIRRPDDIEYLKEIPGFKLVHIFADIKKRYERITKRTENPDDLQKTFDQFKTEHNGEAELKISEIASHADIEINNNGTLEELREQIDKIIVKL